MRWPLVAAAAVAGGVSAWVLYSRYHSDSVVRSSADKVQEDDEDYDEEDEEIVAAFQVLYYVENVACDVYIYLYLFNIMFLISVIIIRSRACRMLRRGWLPADSHFRIKLNSHFMGSTNKRQRVNVIPRHRHFTI